MILFMDLGNLKQQLQQQKSKIKSKTATAATTIVTAIFNESLVLKKQQKWNVYALIFSVPSVILVINYAF